MKKGIQTTTQKQIIEPRIFQMTVRNDAHHIGLVVAYPMPDTTDTVKVKGQIKIFPNETEKLQYLSKAQKKGFRNFSTQNGKIDIENMILSELARRQNQQKKKEE